MTKSDSINCPICNSTNLKPLPFGYDFNDRRLDSIECESCGIIFIHPQPTNNELVEMYKKEYFESDYRCGHEGSYFDERSLKIFEDDKLFDKVKRFKSIGKFLEIGCAGGALLNAARKHGFHVHGIELSEEAAKFGREKFNIQIDVGDVISVNLPASTFDVVFMGDVLEHIPDPVATIKRINFIMKKGGVLIVRCPMQTNTLFSRIGFWIYNIVNRKATVHLPPYHLFEYRPKSISKLFQMNGFSIESLDEFIIPPSQIALRGSMVEKLLKKSFHYPNYVITKTFKKFGDRIEVYAVKK